MKNPNIEHLIKLLSKFGNKYIDSNKHLKRQNLMSDVNHYDKDLLETLINDPVTYNAYFIHVDSMSIFKKDEFNTAVRDAGYWLKSHTNYKSHVGLAVGKKYLNDSSDVVLNFPHKDCVLQGGMTKEDEKNVHERFYNDVISTPQIDNMFAPKILCHVKKYDKDNPNGVPVKHFDIKHDSLMIKANNLIALHSIEKIYSKSFDAIYLDPPYNVRSKNNKPSKNNTFSYNNEYNQSTWLVFMKNRLDVAKNLLKDTGVLIITISKEELNYLGVMLDEIFPKAKYIQDVITVINNPRGQQGGDFSNTCEYMYYIMPLNKSVIAPRKLKRSERSTRNLRDNGNNSLRTDGKTTFYPFIINPDDNRIIGIGKITPSNQHPKQTEIHDGKIYVYPIDKNDIERKWRYGHDTVHSIFNELSASKINNHHYEINLTKHWGSYRTVWASKKYDSNAYGKKYLRKLVPHAKFSFPKSIYAVYDALNALKYVRNNPNAKVLDFFSGSGTTANAVEMLNHNDGGNRIFVAIEQMSYPTNKNNLTPLYVTRLKNVIKNYHNGSFIYATFLNKNERFVQLVRNAKDSNELDRIYRAMKNSADIRLDVDLKKYESKENGLTKEEKRKCLLDMLDKNQLYYNYADIDDSNVRNIPALSDSDYQFNKSFYDGGEQND